MKNEKRFEDIKQEILADDRFTGEVLDKEKRADPNSRREFLSKIGIGAILAALGGQTFAMLRSLVPNVLYEPDRKFKIGTPDKFTEGGTFVEDKRLFVFKNQNTFHVISAQCTHLGCTVRMQKMAKPTTVNAGGRQLEETHEFHCPCHGSKYYGDGTNYAGPAPRPLDHFRVEVSPEDGQLIVNMNDKVDQDFRLTV
jgi:menaquinol-cytochrome c reductase iron-sulfur subunit